VNAEGGIATQSMVTVVAATVAESLERWVVGECAWWVVSHHVLLLERCSYGVEHNN